MARLVLSVHETLPLVLLFSALPSSWTACRADQVTARAALFRLRPIGPNSLSVLVLIILCTLVLTTWQRRTTHLSTFSSIELPLLLLQRRLSLEMNCQLGRMLDALLILCIHIAIVDRWHSSVLHLDKQLDFYNLSLDQALPHP